MKQLDSDYYVSPEFRDKFTVHFVKNVLDLPKMKVELATLCYVHNF